MTQATFPVTFVSARTHLGKTFTDGGTRRPPHARNLTSVEYPITADRSGLETLTKLVARHSAAGDAYFTGKFRKPLVDESRAGRADTKHRSQVLVVDFDGIDIDAPLTPPIPQSRLTHIATQARELLPEGLHNTACVAHASSGFGLAPGKVNLHLFFLLDKPVLAGQLKAWLARANFENPTLEAGLELHPSGHSLHFPLDRCTAENSRLIYIASPQFESTLLKDPFAEPMHRVAMVEGLVDVAPVGDEINTLSPAVSDSLIADKIKELRRAHGLKGRKGSVKAIETRRGNFHDLLQNPDPVTVEIAYERDPFVYANLNGGDSNAYYWPKDNPKYVYNFKDEPVFELAKAAPEFYRQYLAMASEDSVDEGVRPLIIRDEDADMHLSILYDGNTHKLIKSPKKIGNDKDRQDWYIQHGGEAPDHYETWEVRFDPHVASQLDMEKRRLNTFVPTEFMLMTAQEGGAEYGKAAPVLEMQAPTAHKLIDHMIGHGRIEMEHFLNWLAFAFQYREKTSVAWVFHGVEGTGKGLFYNELLVPLFGQYAMSKKIDNLEDGFDGWREQCLLAVFDEFRMSDAKDGARLYDKLKNMISEPVGTIRPMRSEQKTIKCYENLLFFSNSNDALKISVTDRRFCVPPGQNTPLLQLYNPQKIVQGLGRELTAFAQYLTDFQVDANAARTVLETEAKREMRDAANTWVEDFCSALKRGDLGWFLDNTVRVTPGRPELNTLIARAGEVVADIASDMLAQGDEISYLSVDQAVSLYHALDGGKTTKIAATKVLSRHGCHFVRRRIEGERNRFMSVRWHLNDMDPAEIVHEFGTPLQQAEQNARTH